MASWRSTASCIAAALLLVGCASKPDLPDYGAVQPFQLTEHTAKAFDSAQLKGKVWVADFMFTTCPGPCPRMSSYMHQIQMELEGKGIQLVSFTVDPDHDTPQVLTEYSQRFKASPGVWHFLTGSQPDLNHLAKDVFKLGVVDGSLEHSTRFVLVDGEGRIRGYYPTLEPGSIPRLIDDARALLDS